MNPITRLANYEPTIKERRPPMSDDVKFGLMILVGVFFAISGGVAGCAISNAGPSEEELCYKAKGNWTWAPDKSDNGLTNSKTCVLPTPEE